MNQMNSNDLMNGGSGAEQVQVENDPQTGQIAPEQRRDLRSTKSVLRLALLMLVVFGLILVLGYIPRFRIKEAIAKAAKRQQNAVPVVAVTAAVRSKSSAQLSLPGSTAAQVEAPIYARASGYVAKRLVDIGDHVKAGQLLAIVDAPDLDQQVDQGRASLQQSESVLHQVQAQAKLSSVTWERYKILVARGVLSKQDGDTQEANYNISVANVRAAEDTVNANRANLRRLVELQSYERVLAPFAGVVITRNIDVGSLISSFGGGLGGGVNTAGTGSVTIPVTGSATLGAEMFRIARLDHLRVFVSVPESSAQYVVVGQTVDLTFDSVPGKTFQGKVVRTAHAIDSTTRTMLTEIQVENRDGKLMSGTFATVTFNNIRALPPVIVPGDTIITHANGTSVALVRNNSVHLQPVVLGRDYGAQTEIREGLQEGDLVIVNPGDTAREGATVTARILADTQVPDADSGGKDKAIKTRNSASPGQSSGE
jgi:multidrug efflux pump subunit AcrA (membrane-fusion protein)